MLMPMMPPTISGISATFLATDGAGPGNTQTFTGKSLGTASSDRRIIVAVASASGSTGLTASVTVAGITATKLVELCDNDSGGTLATLFIVHVATGATGDVVVTVTNSARMAIGMWAVYGLSSDTAHATGSSLANPGAVTLNTRSAGLIFAMMNHGHEDIRVAWTADVGTPTERYDQIYPNATSAGHSGADLATTGASTTITATPASSVTRRAMVAASF